MAQTNVFDPLLDPACRPLPRPSYARWQAGWIWFPGQLTAHLHAKAIRASSERCTHIGYPGNYQRPEHHVWFRYRAVFEQPESLRWRTPPGRARMFVNGQALDFTRQAIDLAPGALELVLMLDFCASLPCLLLEGHSIQSDERWETSLDGLRWVQVEADPAMTEPDLPPDASREMTVVIPLLVVWFSGRPSHRAPHQTGPSGRTCSAAPAFSKKPHSGLPIGRKGSRMLQS